MKKHKLVIMIDDDTDDHEIFSIALSEIDAELNCLFFLDCKQALMHFRQPDVEPPSYVFVDINLPSVSGPECLVQLQKLREFDHPCIIIYSTSIPVERKQELKSIGVDKFMEKASSIPVLAGQLKQLMEF